MGKKSTGLKAHQRGDRARLHQIARTQSTRKAGQKARRIERLNQNLLTEQRRMKSPDDPGMIGTTRSPGRSTA